jgi:hypothetical protein
MKRYILIFLSVSLFAQNKNNEVQKLKDSIANIKSVFKDVSDFYCFENFEKYYVKNNNFIEQTSLADKSANEKIVLLNLITKAVRCTTNDQQTIEICNKALLFNINYQELSKIKDTLFTKKYDEKTNEQNIKLLQSFKIDKNTKLDTERNGFVSLLENYKTSTLSLKTFFEEKPIRLKDNKVLDSNLELLKQNLPQIKDKTNKLKTNALYKNYPYLLKIIEKVKNNPNSYNEAMLKVE